MKMSTLASLVKEKCPGGGDGGGGWWLSSLTAGLDPATAAW